MKSLLKTHISDKMYCLQFVVQAIYSNLMLCWLVLVELFHMQIYVRWSCPCGLQWVPALHCPLELRSSTQNTQGSHQLPNQIINSLHSSSTVTYLFLLIIHFPCRIAMLSGKKLVVKFLNYRVFCEMQEKHCCFFNSFPLCSHQYTLKSCPG